MIPSLVAVALLFAPMPVTVFELGTNSEKYHGRFVRIEVVLEDFAPGADRWHHIVAAKNADYVEILGGTAPGARNGDKVAIAGLFRYRKDTFTPRLIHGAVMQKVPFVVGPEELIKDPTKYHGRLVRIEATLKDFLTEDDWSHSVKGTSGRRVVLSGKGKPDVRDGDRVAFTGTYEYTKTSFIPHAVHECKIEKLPPDQLRDDKPTPQKP